MARMMTYAWFDTNHKLAHTKFGDHFVKDDCTYDQAVKHTLDYIRQTQFARQGKYFDTDNVLKQVWDVSDLAKTHNRFYDRSHFDDVVGEFIGRRGTARGGEFHPQSFDEVVLRVNQFISRSNQPLPNAALAQWQYDAAENVMSAIKLDRRVIMAELCARFGKTIWAGALAVETETPLTIVASYVLTSFASFAKDLPAFQQFRELEIVDCSESDYKEQIEAALKSGKQTVAFLSMCGGEKRQDRIDYLFGLDYQRLVFIDEADFGAHTDNQALPFIAAKKSDDTVVLMTGTNADRACGSWEVDHYLGTTYAELLVERREVLGV